MNAMHVDHFVAGCCQKDLEGLDDPTLVRNGEKQGKKKSGMSVFPQWDSNVMKELGYQDAGHTWAQILPSCYIIASYFQPVSTSVVVT